MPPLLAAELHAQGRIHPHDRPMFAAHWLAEGGWGDALVALASLRGPEPEVSELWPLALAELGVPPTTHPRVAMSWAARRVVAGERDARWLVRVLWMEWHSVDEQDDFERLVLLVDDYLDWTDRDLHSRRAAERTRAESARGAVGSAIHAMARDDVSAALAVLTEWGG